MEFGYITISDNAGNTTDCKVRVNHDWTRPTLIITAYKINADGSRGKKESDPVTANEINSAVTIYNYYDAVNGWLNLSLFPKGIEYVVTTSDNVKLNQGRWYENNAGIYNLSASNLENYMAGTPTNFTTTNNTASMKFTQAGLRRGKYTLTDAAGNSVLIKVKADIDHTIPKCKTTKSHTGHTDGVHATVYCTDGQSGCVKSEETHTGVKRTTSYTVKDKAGNESSPCEITVTARDCNCSNCYYGENTCKYGCSTCSAFTYESTCSGYGSGCTAKVTNWGTDCSCPCNCSSCHTGHNTCRYGCDTCYH